MVLTVPSDLSRARHRPGLHSEVAAIRPSHRARSSTSGPGESRRVFVPLELSSELCPSPNLLGRSGWVRKSSTAARYTLSANSRCERMKANLLVPGLQPKGSPKATSVHRMQHSVAIHDRFVLQFSERNSGLQNTTGSSWPRLRTTLSSIRQSADSGRASSSFTSVGGNTSASRPAPSASWPPQRQALQARSRRGI
jgi:hypothetical protein